MASYREQLTRLQARLASVQAEIEKITPLAAAEPAPRDLADLIGNSFFVRVGRCTANAIPKIRQGVVVATKPAEGKLPDQARVQFGEGFDLEVVTVFTNALYTDNESATAAVEAQVRDYRAAVEAAAAEAAKREADAAAGAQVQAGLGDPLADLG